MNKLQSQAYHVDRPLNCALTTAISFFFFFSFFLILRERERESAHCRISIVFESTENIFGHDDFNNVNIHIMEETEEPAMTPTDLLERLGLLEFYPQRLTVQMALEKTFSLPDLQTEEGNISTQQLPWYFLKVSYISS